MRRHLSGITVVTPLASVLVALAVGGCREVGSAVTDSARAAQQQVQGVTITRLRAEPRALTGGSGMRTAQRLVVQDSAAWRSIWSTIFGGTSPQPPLPTVDFAREVMVVVSLGERPTGGYDILVDSATADGNGAIVWLHTTAPGAGCLTTQALTQPVDAARLQRVAGRVTFREQSTVRSCQ